MKKQLRPGFTLVELLVVIAILAILAALVIGGTGAAMASAKATRTVSNMKEVNTALIQISQDGADTGYHPPSHYPPYQGVEQTEDSTRFLWWDLVGAELGVAEPRGERYVWNIHPSESVLQNPLSRKKLGGSGKKERKQIIRLSPDDTKGSFTINAKLSPFLNEENEAGMRAVRVDEVEDSSNTIFFAEADDNLKGKRNITWAFFGTKNAPQGNHKDGAYCLFLDGGVKKLSNKDLKNPKKLRFYMEVGEKDYSLR